MATGSRHVVGALAESLYLIHNHQAGERLAGNDMGFKSQSPLPMTYPISTILPIILHALSDGGQGDTLSNM